MYRQWKRAFESMKIDMKRFKIIWCVLGTSSSFVGK